MINHCKGSTGGGGGGIPVHRRHPRRIKAENGARGGEWGGHRRQLQQQHGEREREQRVVGVVTGPEAVIPMQPAASHCCHHHQGTIIQHCQ